MALEVGDVDAAVAFRRDRRARGRGPRAGADEQGDARRHFGLVVEIWAKREDCNSGLAYGGLAQGCDTLVSIGGVHSTPSSSAP